MSWSSPPGAYGAADPLFLLLIALAIEAYVGDRPFRFRWVPNPRRPMARLVLELERRLNRPERGASDRRVRGIVVAAALAPLSLAAGWLVALFTRHYPFAWVVELFLLVLLVDQRATWQRAAAVARALDLGSLVRAGEALRLLASEHLEAPEGDAPDTPGLVEETVTAIGRRFAAALMGPVFWYVLLGLPGLFLQQMSYVLGVSLSRRAGAFGDAAVSLSRGLSYLPCVLAGAILAAAAVFVPGGRPLAALRRAPGRRGDPAGALTAALGPASGPRRISRALTVFAVACLINAGLVALVALIRLAP